MAKVIRKNKEQKSKKESLFLFIFPVLFMLFLLCIISLISVLVDLQKGSVFKILLVIIASCSFISAFLSGKTKRQHGLITGIIYNLPFIVVLTTISLVLNQFSFNINLLISLVVSVLASSIGGVIGVNIRQRVKRITK